MGWFSLGAQTFICLVFSQETLTPLLEHFRAFRAHFQMSQLTELENIDSHLAHTTLEPGRTWPWMLTRHQEPLVYTLDSSCIQRPDEFWLSFLFFCQAELRRLLCLTLYFLYLTTAKSFLPLLKMLTYLKVSLEYKILTVFLCYRFNFPFSSTWWEGQQWVHFISMCLLKNCFSFSLCFIFSDLLFVQIHRYLHLEVNTGKCLHYLATGEWELR